MGEQMKDYQIRSDFADEIISGSSEEEAYSHQTHEGEHVRVSHVCIHRADNVLGKQPGDYISIEFDSLHEHEAREEVIESLRAALCALMKDTVRRIRRSAWATASSPAMRSALRWPAISWSLRIFMRRAMPTSCKERAMSRCWRRASWGRPVWKAAASSRA